MGKEKEADAGRSDGRISESKEIVSYLSNEITSATTAIMQFRNRISFTVFVGPFILLGSVIIAAGKVKLEFKEVGWVWWLWALGAAAGFVYLGWIAGGIEQHAWNQVKKWRELLVAILAGNVVTETEAKSHIVESGVSGVRLNYLRAFLVILVTFVAIGYLAYKSLKFGGN